MRGWVNTGLLVVIAALLALSLLNGPAAPDYSGDILSLQNALAQANDHLAQVEGYLCVESVRATEPAPSAQELFDKCWSSTVGPPGQ